MILRKKDYKLTLRRFTKLSGTIRDTSLFLIPPRNSDCLSFSLQLFFLPRPLVDERNNSSVYNHLLTISVACGASTRCSWFLRFTMRRHARFWGALRLWQRRRSCLKNHNCSASANSKKVQLHLLGTTQRSNARLLNCSANSVACDTI